MFVPEMPAQRQSLDKRMHAQPKHHAQWNSSRMVVVRVSMLNPVGKEFQQKLDEETGEEESEEELLLENEDGRD